MKKHIKLFLLLTLTLSVSFTAYSDTSEPDTHFTIITWNLEGPKGIENKDLKGFSHFAQRADVIVLEEVLGIGQVHETLEAAGMNALGSRVSDFTLDSHENKYAKQEVAILSPHEFGSVVEVDPYETDDTVQMRDSDVDMVVPEDIPESQRKYKGSRGWLWVEIPKFKLVVAGVHLKSSRGNVGKKDEKNSFKREAVAAALATAIQADQQKRKDWSYVVAGDFNVSPGDQDKVGIDFSAPCSPEDCVGYDQTHAIFGEGVIKGFAMRNLVEGISASYAKGNYAQSPIDNVYAIGPLFDKTTKLIVERGDHYGSDHYAVKITLEN